MADEWKEITPEQEGDSNIWDKSKNPEIIGVYQGAQTNVGPNKSMLYKLETDDGVVKVWGSTVLDDRMSSAQIGQKVKIKYEGKKQGDKGRNYNAYRVWVM